MEYKFEHPTFNIKRSTSNYKYEKPRVTLLRFIKLSSIRNLFQLTHLKPSDAFVPLVSGVGGGFKRHGETP